ncbi:MAG TPA: amidohydrolase family protein [Xanthobacteraceae bacterium]|nr:amidohydrolase family protein [Xanthobacteraceae bacterium]
MIVDCHAHLVPQALLDTMRKERARFPSVRLIEEGGNLSFSFMGGKPTRPVAKGLSDVPARLAWMDKQGIERQVAGGWIDTYGYEMPPAEGEAWSRLINDAQIAAAKAQPRFTPLATVPLQDGARAANVLKAAIAAGFSGVMIATLPRGIGSVLDSPDLDPFWKAADETGAAVLIHPSFDAGDARVNDYGLANGVGRISDAIVAVARLLHSGHVTRYRNAKIVVPMGAAALPFVIGRLKKNHKITPGTADPVEALALLYTDTILHDPRVLKFVIEMIGADRLMMGSDVPFPIGDDEPMKIVAAAELSADQVAAINGGTAAKVFRMT